MIVKRLKRVTSTNDYALRLGSVAREREDMLIVADEQSSGRGSHDRKWFATPGESATFSFLIFPDEDFEMPCGFAAQIADEIADILNAELSIGCYLKPPNDVYVDGKKIAGILIETKIISEKIQYIVVGVGLNVNQRGFAAGLEETATSIYQVTGEEKPIDEIIELLYNKLYNNGILGKIGKN